MRVVPLNRKINPRYRVFIFILNSWIYLLYKVLSSFIKSNLLHVRITVCVCSHFFSPRNRTSKMRERHKLLFGLQLLVSKKFHHVANSKQSNTLAESFHQSAPVKIGSSTCKPNMPEVGFYEAAQNFVYQIYSRVRSKKIKTYSAGLIFLSNGTTLMQIKSDWTVHLCEVSDKF